MIVISTIIIKGCKTAHRKPNTVCLYRHLNVAPSKKVKQLSVVPQFFDIQRKFTWCLYDIFYGVAIFRLPSIFACTKYLGKSINLMGKGSGLNQLFITKDVLNPFQIGISFASSRNNEEEYIEA